VGSLTIPNLVDEIIAQVSSARDLEEEETSSEAKAEAKEGVSPAKADRQIATRLVA
jgi:hypothetical protein